MKKTPADLLRESSEIISERGAAYGDYVANLQLTADMASLRLGRSFHSYEIAVILACLKNARSFASPDDQDSHLDAMAYESFAATLAADYVASKPTDAIDYKRRADFAAATARDLKPAVVKAGQVRALEPLAPSKFETVA